MQIDPARSALLLLDYSEGLMAGLADAAAIVEAASELLAAARAAALPVIFVTAGFRPGCPEISPRNAGFSAFRASGAFDRPASFPPALTPLANEPVVIKKRVSAFAGSDLAVLLRAQDIHTLIMAGIWTSGVVLSTLREAADADFALVLARDACGDPEPEVHRVLMDKVFPRQAQVVPAAQIAALIAAGAHAP